MRTDGDSGILGGQLHTPDNVTKETLRVDKTAVVPISSIESQMTDTASPGARSRAEIHAC